ncbi:DUF397 domain-containing protein [Actinoplanes sp. NPDC051346]|uniref:DUF397 domain-containing protein n=1 Tax=Actinoplanes sp. NPDC051346 TaxID=3155048 RepID=UPI0034488119
MGNIGPKWKKSSRSSSNGNCVEVRKAGELIQVRDSKDPVGPLFAFSPTHWQAFVDGVKLGKFN